MEWGTEWLVAGLRRWAFVDLLQLIGSFSIILAAVSYCSASEERSRAAHDARKAKHYQAWQVISLARGSTGNGGRVEAIHDLYSDQQPLVGIDLRHAHLEGLVVPYADFRSALLDSAWIDFSDGRLANFTNAAAHGGAMIMGSMDAAYFDQANLADATLLGSFCYTSFVQADLRGSRIYADVHGATFRAADLRNAGIDLAVLSVDASSNDGPDDPRPNDSTDLPGLDNIDLRGANVYGLHAIRMPAFTLPGGVSPDYARFDSSMIQRALSRGAVAFQDDSTWVRHRAADSVMVEVERVRRMHSRVRTSLFVQWFMGEEKTRARADDDCGDNRHWQWYNRREAEN